MTTPSREAPDLNVRRRHGPRNRIGAESPKDDSVSLCELRDHTAGLSNRLQDGLPSIEAMRAGTAWSPQGMIRRYFLTASRRGLPKSWALRLVLWAQRQADLIWTDPDHTPLSVLDQKAMALEGAANLAEKRHDLERTAITLRERIRTESDEVVAKMLCLAKLEREMAELAR